MPTVPKKTFSCREETNPNTLKRLKTKRTNLLRKLKREATAANITKNGYAAFWRNIKQPIKTIAVQTESGITSEPDQVLETLTEQFKRTQAHKNIDIPKIRSSVRKVIEPLPPWELELMTESQMSVVISSLRNKKSKGPDASSFFIIKILKPVITSQLTQLANQIIRQGTWPATLAQARITAVPKNKNTNTGK